MDFKVSLELKDEFNMVMKGSSETVGIDPQSVFGTNETQASMMINHFVQSMRALGFSNKTINESIKDYVECIQSEVSSEEK